MDYSKLKVTELKELLQARSLPVSGKKEDLVARLTESDAAKRSAANDLGDLAPPEEEYDWDAPVPQSPPKAATKPIAAPAPATVAPKPVTPRLATSTAPKQALEAPKPSSAAAAQPPPATSGNTKNDDVFAAELEKRKRRAERFGIQLGDDSKARERAKRFGTDPPTTEGTKKRARDKRFGNQVWAKTGQKGKPHGQPPANVKILDDPVEAEKARKRAERFSGASEPKKIKT